MTPFKLCLLGPPRIEAGDGRAVRFPDRRSIGLLAILGVDGRTARARLATLLWDEHADTDLRRNLRRELNRMRDAGLDAMLESRSDSVGLAAGVAVDLADFERALAAKDDERVLALHGGGLLAGFALAAAPAFDDWLGARREAVAQRWRKVAERRCEVLAAAGDVREALAEASRLIADDSLQEAHYRRVMTLHLQLGEREAALQVFERCRRALGRELGLRPLPETLALAETIRASTPVSTPVSNPPASSVRASALLPDHPALVGRGDTLAVVRKALAGGALVVVEGSAGVGKSRLLEALVEGGNVARVHAARASDVRVPFASLARWLREGRSARGTAAGALAPWACVELARLLPELGPAADAPASDAQRLRLYEAAGLAWSAWCGDDLVHAFDDWQFVDAESAAWWAWWRDAAPWVVVVARRPGEARSDAAALLDEAVQAAATSVIALDPLDEAAVLELVRSLSGSDRAERFSRRLWRATGGNPFFVLETLAQLIESGVLGLDTDGRWSTPFDEATEDYRELPLPPSVHAAVVARVRALGEAPQRLLEAASLIGDDFNLPLARSASALGEWEALAALEAALAARLLRRRPEAPGTFGFEHDLIAQSLQRQLAPERRALVHRSLSAELARQNAPAAQVAEHAERGGDPAAACRWRLLALDAARRRFALADVLAEADRVLALEPTPAQAIAAHLARADAWLYRADGEQARAALAAAESLLGDDDPPALRVRIVEARASQAPLSTSPADIVAPITALLGDPRLSDGERARLHIARAECLRVVGRLDEAEADLIEALARLDPGAAEERGVLLERLARTFVRQGRLDAALQRAGEAIALLSQANHPAGLARAYTVVGISHMHSGRVDEAVGALVAARGIAAAAGLVQLERGAILNLIPALHILGDYDRAAALVDEGVQLSPVYSSDGEAQAFVEARHVCRCITGDLDAALDAWDELVRINEGVGDTHRRRSGWLVAAELPLLLGDVERATQVVERAQRRDADDTGQLVAQALAKAACLAVLRGDLMGAVQALEAAAALPSESPDDLAYRKAAELRARHAGAVFTLDRPAITPVREGATAEVWSLYLAAAIAHEHATSGLRKSTAEAALRELASGKVPPLNALELLEALDDAHALDGAAAAWRAKARTLARRLLGSLARHPQHAERFARRHARWLS